MLKRETKIRKTLNYLIRVVIIAVTYGFIYYQVFYKHRPEEIIHSVESILNNRQVWALMGLVLGLMILNWGLESFKWKLLISKIEKVSFFRAYKAVLTGVSVSLFTPNRTGDYLGRVFILDKGSHVEGILLTLVGSLAQLVVTLSVGLFSLLLFTDQYLCLLYKFHGYLFAGLILIIPIVVFFLLVIYFKIGLLSDFLSRYFPGKWANLIKYTAIFSRFSSRELLWNLLLSLARYFVFSIQFLLLLKLSGAYIPLQQGLVLVPVIYLIMAGVPSIALADLGIRGSVSLYVLGLYFSANAAGSPVPDISILAASTLLWLINLIVPAILGTLFVFNLKFFRNNSR